RFDLELTANPLVQPPVADVKGGPRNLFLTGSPWKYFASNTAPGSTWKDKGFNDSGWPSGISGLGYPSGEFEAEHTLVPSGCTPVTTTCSNRIITTYFRKTVTISTIPANTTYSIRYKRDDGIAIYINGREIKRENLPTGAGHTTPAGTELTTTPAYTGEQYWQVLPVPAGYFQAGENLIAAEVHQAAGGEPDMRFDMELRQVEPLVRGPYLQMGTPTAMTLRWRTSTAVRGQVKYGLSATDYGQVVTEATAGLDHEVRLTGLTPGTKYFYSIETAGVAEPLQRTPDNFFITSPPAGSAKKVRIWAMGDFGEGSRRQFAVRDAFMNNSNVQNQNVDLWLWLGDNAYLAGHDEDYQYYLFNVYDHQRLLRQTPVYATPGNHEYANNNITRTERTDHKIDYYKIISHFTQGEGGGVASGKEEFYSFNYGNIHFVSLDSYGYESGQGTTVFSPTGPQMTWLKNDLNAAKNDPNIKWTIAFWHHPPYTMGTKDSDVDGDSQGIRKNLLPVLEQYKVDLVLCGHSHVYERSRLMKGHHGENSPESTFNPNLHLAPAGNNGASSGRFDGSPNSCFYYKSTTSATNEGTIYLVSGSGGAGLDPGKYTPKGKWPHNAMLVSDTLNGGSMFIEVEGNRLDVKFIAEDNQVRDQFTIMKDTEAFPIPPTDGTARTAACECTDAQGWTHYTDNRANLLLSVKKNGQAIGRVGDGTFSMRLEGSAGALKVNKNCPANYVTLPAGWWVMKRFWTLKPTTEPTVGSSLAVRHYYRDADLSAVNANLPAALSHQQLKVFKMNDINSPYTPNPVTTHATVPKATAYNTNGAWLYDQAATPSVTNWTYRALGNGNHFAEFMVGRLGSGGGLGGAENGQNPSSQPCSGTNLIVSGDSWRY
ncbi:purple acid phosphatase family protein, partial [Larkinella soli]|uniref:purple acid phosphatase family protein n=1 Tax=Larkinella soli TaxID=1770527 RepID=UPI0013E340A9